MPSETESAFNEIQDVGMADIGVSVEFEMDGGKYHGIVNDPQVATQMLTGAYQGRAEIMILATISQFPAPPAQKGILTINEGTTFPASQWNRKQVNIYNTTHYAIQAMHQLNST